MSRSVIAAFIALLSGAVSAQATQVCAWVTESNQPGHMRTLDLWLQSDADIDFVYEVSGRGIATIGGDANAPKGSTYHLDPDQPRRAWTFTSSLYPPAKIEVLLNIKKMPTDVYSAAPTPLLAKFAFKREVPADETAPPDILAQKQCMEIVTGGLPL
jgi:hypothetical protein